MHCVWLYQNVVLKMLDPIHNSALRLCVGAFRTSPASSKSVMANEPPLQLRRQKLTLQYCVKLASNPRSPDYSCVFNPQFKAQFIKKPNQIATLGIRTSQMLRDIGLIRKDIVINKSPLLHPGCWQGQSLILSCTVMTNHLPVRNYIKVNFWRSDTAF